MLYTTYTLLRQAGASRRSYHKLARYLGGIKKYGRDTLIPISAIVKSNGLQDAIWALQHTTKPGSRVMCSFAYVCARHMLKDFEACYPNDTRPRQAIEAARLYLADNSAASRAATRDASALALKASNVPLADLFKMKTSQSRTLHLITKIIESENTSTQKTLLKLRGLARKIARTSREIARINRACAAAEAASEAAAAVAHLTASRCDYAVYIPDEDDEDGETGWRAKTLLKLLEE